MMVLSAQQMGMTRTEFLLEIKETRRVAVLWEMAPKALQRGAQLVVILLMEALPSMAHREGTQGTATATHQTIAMVTRRMGNHLEMALLVVHRVMAPLVMRLLVMGFQAVATRVTVTLAMGLLAMGLLAMGLLAMGLLAMGLLAMGLLAVGLLAVGLLVTGHRVMATLVMVPKAGITVAIMVVEVEGVTEEATMAMVEMEAAATVTLLDNAIRPALPTQYALIRAAVPSQTLPPVHLHQADFDSSASDKRLTADPLQSASTELARPLQIPEAVVAQPALLELSASPIQHVSRLATLLDVERTTLFALTRLLYV